MSDYPLASLPRNRSCTNYIYGNLTVCPTFPCEHTQCHDADYLVDFEDFLTDERSYLEMCKRFRSPEYAATLPPDVYARYEAKFDRCRRLKEKEGKRKMSMDAHREWVREQRALYWDRESMNTPEPIKAVLEKVWAIERELADEVIKELGRRKEERKRLAGLKKGTTR